VHEAGNGGHERELERASEDANILEFIDSHEVSRLPFVFVVYTDIATSGLDTEVGGKGSNFPVSKA